MIRALVLIWCLALAAAAAERVTVSDGLLSYAMPDGWRSAELAGLTEKAALGPAADGFAVNINFVIEPAAMPLADYVVASKAALAQMMNGYQLADERDFAIAPDLTATRLVVLSHQGRFDLRQVFFLVPGRGDTKYVMTCSALAADADRHDAVFDAAARSITLN